MEIKPLTTFFLIFFLIGLQNHQKEEAFEKSFNQIQDVTRVQDTRIKNILTEVNGNEVFISYPEDKQESNTYPVVMAIHGSGREARSYMPGDEKSVDFYIHQRDLAVKNGFMFVVLSNGIDTWGTDEGIRNLKDLYHFVQSNYNVEKKWTLWATSAGGSLMNRLIRECPEIVSRAIGTFPVYDISDSMKRSNGAKKTWSGKTDELREVNPSLYPEALINVPFLIYHGKDDQVVPPKFHSQKLQDEVNNRGGNVALYLVDGGHSTQNWNVYDDEIIIDFLKSDINKQM